MVSSAPGGQVSQLPAPSRRSGPKASSCWVRSPEEMLTTVLKTRDGLPPDSAAIRSSPFAAPGLPWRVVQAWPAQS